MVLGLPITETDTVSAPVRHRQQPDPRVPAARRPQPIVDYINALGTAHVPRLARASWAGRATLVNNLLTPTRGTLPARLAGNRAARLDRRVLQAQLQLLQVLAAVAPPGAQHARRTRLWRQLRRRRDARHLLHRGTVDATTTRQPGDLPARRPSPASRLADYATSPPTACRSSRTSTPAACARCAASATTPSARARRRSPAARSPQPLGGALKTDRLVRDVLPDAARHARPRASRRSSTSATCTRDIDASTPASCAPPPAWR